MTTQRPRVPLVPARIVLLAGVGATLVMGFANPVVSAEPVAQQQVVDKAQLTLEAFAADGQLKDQFKQLSKEKHGVKKEKYLRVESEPAIETTPTEYSGVYRVTDMPFTLRFNVDSKGVVTGSGDEALTESVRRTFTLRNGKVQGALLTATKVYSDGAREKFEGSFLNRTDRNSPTEPGVTIFGLGVVLTTPFEVNGLTYDKLFYHLK